MLIIPYNVMNHAEMNEEFFMLALSFKEKLKKMKIKQKTTKHNKGIKRKKITGGERRNEKRR